jgi:hypothetical protein
MAAYSNEVSRVCEQVGTSMIKLRDSMKGIQIRTAGFKRLHDELARKVARLNVHLAESAPDMLPK